MNKATFLNRRNFLGAMSLSVGLPALDGLLAAEATGMAGSNGLPHFPPKAKRVIYMMQSGGPSHIDLFDDKETLKKMQGEEVPDSILQGLRQTTMTAGQKSKPCLPAAWGGRRRGESGMWISDLLPYTAKIVDDLCFVRSVHGEQINHAPAMTHMLTGHNLPGRPSIGAWLTYGLGSMADDLPSFVVMTSQDREASCGQLFFNYYWGAGKASRGRGDVRCWTVWRSLTISLLSVTPTPKSKRESRSTKWPFKCRRVCLS